MIFPVPSLAAGPRPRALAWRAFLALPLALVAACSSGDPDLNKSTMAAGSEKRDTEIKHEDCNGNSASANKVDINGDGKPDIVHVMSGNREVCRIVDLNLDGAVDAFIYYDEQGRERRRESDFDRDGRADEIAIAEGGVITLKLRETNFDNKLDTWDFYQSGVLVRRERDSDGDGIIDQWWQFNNPQSPKCAVVSSDRNADGKPDPDSVVDLCGESYGTAPATVPGAPPAPSAAPGAPHAGAPMTPPGPAGAPDAVPGPGKPGAASVRPQPGAPDPSASPPSGPPATKPDPKK
jgi:hypothetical protein